MNPNTHKTSNQSEPFPAWLRGVITAGWCMAAAAGVLSIVEGEIKGWVVLVCGVLAASSTAAISSTPHFTNLFKGMWAFAAILMIVGFGAKIFLYSAS